MKKRMIRILALLLVFGNSFLFGCERQPQKYTEYTFEYFDTITSVTGYVTRRDDFDRVWNRVKEELNTYHRLYTIYDSYEGVNNLYTVNRLIDGAHREVEVDPKIMDLLHYGKRMYELTDGQLNIAMGSVLSIWHSYREAGISNPAEAKLPSIELLREAAKHTDIERIILNEEAGTVYLSDPEMSLDVGAVAKGYAVEMIAQMLENEGVTGYVLNVGGNVRTLGARGDGSSFAVGIENPDSGDENGYLAVLSLRGESLVTSGSYQRYYTVEGMNYHHIIDPTTLMPATGYRSVSVICASSADGDALSTALFTLSYEEGLSLLSKIPGAEALWVLEDGTQCFSEGFGQYLQTQKS
ncbi:MAG: FAD:protein FMN transferase [Clostridia bacterium]|nr:FAD:protein FMN transferase [Clostridia bacterium]